MIEINALNEEIVDKNNLKKITKYLKDQRSSIPEKFVDYISLNHKCLNDFINFTLFNEKLEVANSLIKPNFSKFRFIPIDNYLVTFPSDSDIGGFYGKKLGGFYYFNLIGFSTLLNNKIINNRDLITLELFRNYIHDSIHFSTFRTFNSYIENKELKVYREQYGFNYRNKEGMGYSNKELTKNVPKAINLNLLMDGVNAIYTASIMESIVKKSEITIKSDIERELLKDILTLKIDNYELLQNKPKEFYNQVIEPTSKYVNFWGGNNFILLCLQSMFSGEKQILESYFEKQTKISNYWSKTFKRKNFKL